MTDIMYDIPSRDDVSEVIITRECVVNKAEPKLILKAPAISAPTAQIDLSDVLPEVK